MKLFLLVKFQLRRKTSLRDIKKKDCDILPSISTFYDNLIIENKSNLRHIINSPQVNKSINFLLRSFNANSKVIKDETINENIIRVLYENEHRLSYKLDYIKIFNSFYKVFADYPNNDFLKSLVNSLKTKNYFFHRNEIMYILGLFEKMKKINSNISLKMIEEVENVIDLNDDITKNTKNHLAVMGLEKLKSVNVVINHEKDKIKITSSKFYPKLRIIGIDEDRASSIGASLDNLFEESPNIVILQKRPAFGIGNENIHYGCLDSNLLKSYGNEILSNKNKFIIKRDEKIVYLKHIEDIKTSSTMESLIFRALFNLTTFGRIKFYFSDLPIYRELEILVKKNSDISKTKDFLSYLKLNMLLEKYNWYDKVFSGACPTCQPVKLEYPRLNPEDALDPTEIDEKFEFIAENIVNVIKANPREPYIYAFLEKKNLYLILEKVIRKLEIIDDFQNMNWSFNLDYGNIQDLIEENKRINNEPNDVFLNKLALFSNIYPEITEIPEYEQIKKEFPEFEELNRKYYEKIHYVSELKKWKGKVTSYRCYPAHIMINDYLLKNI